MFNGIYINYYFICHRKLWLFSNGIGMEHTSDLVYKGRLIHEYAYAYRKERFKELEIEHIKIDFYDSKKNVIHEIKKSNKYEEAHVWQLKYYIYILENQGIKGVTGILEYPELKKTKTVILSNDDRKTINEITKNINKIINSESCPNRLNQNKCNNCSYYDFCWSGEIEE